MTKTAQPYKWYKLVFRQVQPIHVGQGRFGVLGQTRIFIPGWTIWGALTKAYNLEQGVSLNENQSMFEVITNFFPTFDPKGEKVLFPKYKDGAFHLGEYSEERFRAILCDVFMSTAVLPISRQAKEASLHELEFILPRVKKNVDDENKGKQIYWVGVVGIKGDLSATMFPKQIFIGGDRRYGYGLMELADIFELDGNKLKDWQLDERGCFVDNGKPIVHFVAKSNENKQDRLSKGKISVSKEIKFGEIELLPEFRFYESGGAEGERNYRFEGANYFYVPGCK